jgi:hypothetical protein
MGTILEVFGTPLAAAGVGLVVDFLRNLGPRLIYSSTQTIPVRGAGSSDSVGGYALYVRNDSRKKAEEITIHLRAGTAALRVEDYAGPPGLQLAPLADKSGIKIPLPYLKPAVMLRLRLVAEGGYVPQSLDVSFSSPNKISTKEVADVEAGRSFFRFTLIALFGTITLVFVFLAGRASQPSENSGWELTRRQVMVSAAADSGLPNLAAILVAANDPSYYEGADLAYSLAASSKSPTEADKYRKYLSLTLRNGDGMLPESQANLFYTLGRLDLLLSDENSATNDLKAAIAKSRPTVERRLKSDPQTREFLARKGII